MRKILMEHKNILGITMKYEAFYFGTVCYKEEILHIISEKEILNALGSVALTDEEFNEHCKFIEAKIVRPPATYIFSTHWWNKTKLD